jgi:hypothetical protein
MDSPLQALKESRSPKFTWESWTKAHAPLIALAVIAIGFELRIREAWGTFLNPDEALHFFIANRPSLEEVYRASLTQAHPPLFFFVLHALRVFGNSEVMLRLPSILAGTLFCWIFFKWLDDRLGHEVALVGVILAALLPTMIDVSAEIRQYGLLLLFLVSGLWLLDRGLETDSPLLILTSTISLWLAMLTHYSSFLFLAAVDVYAGLRIWRNRVSRPTILTWLAGQVLAFSLAVFLYWTHLSKIKPTAMTQQALELWLRRSYFHPGDNPLTFLLSRTFSVFQYVVGQLVVGDILTIVFVAGVFLLMRAKAQNPRNREFGLGVLLIVPFVLNYGAGLLDLYPFGGTRHCIYLSIFVITGIAIGIAELTRRHMVRSTAITVSVVVLCFVFRTVHHPYIARAEQARSRMDAAITFVETQIPASQTILADYESGIELGHYLCKQEPVAYEDVPPDFLIFNCGRHRVISTVPDQWAFTPKTLFKQLANLVERGYLKPDERVWVVQAGWIVSLDEDLRATIPELRDLRTQTFGNNIRFLQLSVGSH